MSTPIDRFMPHPDVRSRHETMVHAPVAVVHQVAREFDFQSVPAVRAIFWLRATLLRSRSQTGWRRRSFVDEALAMGWGRLVDEPGRLFIAGAVCQPWLADVVFTPLPPEEFAAYAEPDRVKIAWTLETEPLTPELTRLATETRALATDDRARVRFRWYWRMVGLGILAIRPLVLPAMRREAERRWRAQTASRARLELPVAPAEVGHRPTRAAPGERAAPLAGDDIVKAPIAIATHAITIRRPAREVWPWLAQMGAGRAGWYSYDAIDNGGARSADRLLSEFQGVRVGTLFPAVPGAKDAFLVLRSEPMRSLVLGWAPATGAVPVTTWAFVLNEPEPGRTRLIVRGRIAAGYRPYGLPTWLAVPLGRVAHAIMQRKQLLGIAERVETRGRQLDRYVPAREPALVRG